MLARYQLQRVRAIEVLSFVRPSPAAVVIIGSPTMAHGLASACVVSNGRLAFKSIRPLTNTSISSSIHGSQASTVNLDRDTDRSSRSTGSLPMSQPQSQSRRTPSSLPLTYNPAAPVAPEAIEHREKTPPPEDGAENTLMSTAIADQGRIYGVPYQYSGGGFSRPLHHSLSPQRQVSLYSQNLRANSPRPRHPPPFHRLPTKCKTPPKPTMAHRATRPQAWVCTPPASPSRPSHRPTTQASPHQAGLRNTTTAMGYAT